MEIKKLYETNMNSENPFPRTWHAHFKLDV